MNKELEIKQNVNRELTIDSREVAEMVEKPHDQLMRSIRGYIKVLDDSAKLQTPNFFIESTYINSQNKQQPCYLLTKKGCDMVANKMTGDKGILFTATYVTKFEEMENQIKQESQFKLPTTYKEALLQLVEQVEQNEKLELENSELKEENKLKDLENRLLSGEVFAWADTNLINSLVRSYSSSVYGDFSKGWKDFKRNLLYSHSINLNSRITTYLNASGRKTKPKTLSMLKGQEEISNAISTIVSMCKEEDVDISNNLKHYLEGDK